MIRLKWLIKGLPASALICVSASAQNDLWSGNSSPNINDPLNWSNGVPNAGLLIDFSPAWSTGPHGNQMFMNGGGSALGVTVDSSGGMAGDISITGGHPLTLGASGIAMNQSDNTSASMAMITAPLVLSANQTWSINNSSLQVTGDISESSAGTSLVISNTGGTLINAELDSPNSTFSGGLTLTGGAGTVLVVGASSTGPGGAPTSGPLGTGTFTLGSLVDVTTPAAAPSITIANNIAIGTGLSPATATIQAGFGSGGLVLTGTINDGGGFPGTIDVTGPNIGTVDFEGNNTYSGGTNITFATVKFGTDSAMGTGPVTASNSTLKFNDPNPSLTSPTFSSSIVTFNSPGFASLSSPTISNSIVTFPGGGGSFPSLINPTLFNSTLNFGAGSTVSITDMTSDALGSTNAINLGANMTTLQWRVDADTKYYGTITGVGSSVTINSGVPGPVTLDLYGANTYSGVTNISSVSSSIIVVADNNSAFGTSSVNVNPGGVVAVANGVAVTNPIVLSGGAVAGYGTFAPAMADPLLIQNGAMIVGGKGTQGDAFGPPVPGTLTFGANASTTLGPNGTMQFSIMNAGGMNPGMDFSAINSSGSVNITATDPSPFTIQLVAVNPASGQFQLNSANFNNATGYTWTLLTAGSPITGFTDSGQFNVDGTTDFQNPFGGGTFTVGAIGDQLMLTFTPVPEPSTWVLIATGLGALGATARRRR